MSQPIFAKEVTISFPILKAPPVTKIVLFIFFAKYFLDNNLLDARDNFVKDISGIIKEGKDIISISEKWIKDNDTLNLKLEWMSQILSDSIKFHADKSIESLLVEILL